MKQHPVPQNITSYQFRLIGEMTLKQFLELAGGVVTAYLIFHLNLPYFIKWPLVVFFALLGFALAFLPIQGRPLDRWIINFIKSIYSPTLCIWKKNNQPPDFLQPRPSKVITPASVSPAAPSKDKTGLKEYLSTLPASPSSSFVSPLDKAEKEKLENVSKLLTVFSAPAPTPSTPVTAPAAPAVPPSPATLSQPPRVEPARPLTPPMQVNSLFPVEQKLKPEIAALFPQKISLPAASDAPNVFIGVISTIKGKIIPGALVEIKNSQGEIVRALKTNKSGRFFTAAPLENGDYKVKVEHDDYDFDIIDLKAEGKIIPPVSIKAKNEEITHVP